MARPNRQVLLREIPTGKLEQSHFDVRDGECGDPGDGEVLVKTRLLSIDAANRAWMQGATYRSALSGGDVMAGGGLAEVIESRADTLAPGDIVNAETGWQEYAVVPARQATKIDVKGALTNYLSVLGVTGLTAYLGLTEIGQPKPGETLLVSAAAGATGNVAGQVGRLLGCRVVGVVGSDDKGRILTERLGFDAYVNYKGGNLHKDLKAACPDGIDVFFDNTGGDILGAALFRMNQHGRIVCCGVVSQYDTSNPEPGPRGVPGLLITKRIRMEGFIVFDLFNRRDEALERLSGWVDRGDLVVLEDVFEGLDSAPHALVDLLAGGNVGKRMVRVS
jgi:NADPH-dependent curcumin reductase CurA